MMYLKDTPESLSETARNIVKSTAPVLARRGEDVTTCMYRRMLTAHPELNAYFNPGDQASGRQARTLAASLAAYASNIDDLTVLEPALERIVQKHVSLGVVPEHYPIVGRHLLGAIQEVLGPVATEEVVDAWTEAYGYLAGVLIDREREVFAKQAAPGFRSFRVIDRIPECATITSFHLAPADGAPVAPFRAGQYITLKLDDLGEHGTRRHYSLSSRPGLPHYRVTIKREEPPDGDAGHVSVSRFMHDHVFAGTSIEVGPPCGDFYLREQDDRPVVLLSAGVGLTPLVSMLHQLAHSGSRAPVYFIHGTRNRATHALAAEVREVARARPDTHVHVCYSAPDEHCVPGRDYDTHGRVTMPLIQTLVPGPACTYYLLGPTSFMRDMRRGLRAWGVADAQIHLEFFGPSESLN